MLLSVHIPKTAGVSFRNIIKEHFGPGYSQFYWEFCDAWGRVHPDVPPGATCVHGHFAVDQLANRFPGASFVTWVRDPVDRVASSYFHRLRDPDPRNWISRKVHEEKLSLEAYAEIPEARNEMAHFMGDRQPGDFAFVGIMEEFDESLSRFCDQFGLPPQRSRRDNCNPAHASAHYEIPSETREKILRLNERDAAIYAECLDIFHAFSVQRQLRRAG